MIATPYLSTYKRGCMWHALAGSTGKGGVQNADNSTCSTGGALSGDLDPGFLRPGALFFQGPSTPLAEIDLPASSPDGDFLIPFVRACSSSTGNSEIPVSTIFYSHLTSPSIHLAFLFPLLSFMSILLIDLAAHFSLSGSLLPYICFLQPFPPIYLHLLTTSLHRWGSRTQSARV